MCNDVSDNADPNEVFVNKNADNKQRASFCEKQKVFWSSITVEPIMFVCMLSFFMTHVSIQNLNLEKACRVNLNFDHDVCDAISNRNISGFNSSQQEAVQKLASTANMWRNLLQGTFPFIILLFVGSWSDRNQRRKACIIVPALGEMISAGMLLLSTYFFYEFPLEINVIGETVPTTVTGGLKCLLMGIFTYVSANSSMETRTFRLGVVQIILNLAVALGFALSGVIYTYAGFYGIFSMAFCLYVIGVLYGIIIIKDERVVVKEQQIGLLRDFFDFQNLKDTFKVVFRRREGNQRMNIMLIIFLQMVVVGPFVGELNVFYLYTIYKFQWTEIDYSIFQAISCVTGFIGCACAITIFSKILKWNDAALGFISSFSRLLGCLMFAFAPNSKLFLTGVVLDIFAGAGYITSRTILSKLVPYDELGKAHSLLAMTEAILPLIFGAAYNGLYKMTINIYPGAFFILSGALTIPALIIYLWISKDLTIIGHFAKKEENAENRSLTAN